MEFATSAAVYNQIDLPLFSLPGVALFLLAVLPCAVLAGFFLGSHQHRRTIARGGQIDPTIGETTMNSVLAILGLLLAFSFGNALTVNSTFKTALIDEAAKLGTVFLRTDYLPEPGRTEMRQAILEYARTRVVPEGGIAHNMNEATGFLETTLRAQSRLWSLTVEHTADPMPAPIKTFFAGAMNEVLDAHLYRMRTLSEPVSHIIQLMLLGSAVAALFLVANRDGYRGQSLSWRTFLLPAFLLVLMFTIVDIGRAAQGLIQVDDSTLRATITDMEIAMSSVH